VQTAAPLGLAARFVSGYLIQLKPDVKALDGPSGTEVDFTDLHAWCEVYLPGAGWIGLDPTSGLLAGEGHIPLACTPEPSSAAPVSGAVDECEVEFATTCRSRASGSRPRHQALHRRAVGRGARSLGHRRSTPAGGGDVRLTMGGEPTFVAVTTATAPSGTPMRWARPSAAGHRAGAPPARRIRAGRLPALRPGQVVPGRAAAALGAVDLLARRRPALLARPELFADERDRTHYTSETPSASSHALTRAWA
jgi:hypothetical protein